MYGRSNALVLAKDYYNKALELWWKGNDTKSLFYLGAALHLIQDMTIPQHVNIRLLEDHRQYENFVKRTYQNVKAFRANHGAYLFRSIEFYIRFNARTAIKIYKRFRNITDDESRYYRITKCTLPLAERTTAGAMILFYQTISKMNQSAPI